MSAQLTIPARHYRMYPEGDFLGFTEQPLALPLESTALLAVDIYGDHDRPDVWSGMVSDESTRRGAMILRDRIGPVLHAARAVGMPVVYAANSAPRVELSRSAYGEMKRHTLDVDQDELYADDHTSDTLEFHHGHSEVLRYAEPVRPRDGDYFVRKHVHSAFFDTRLDTLLRNLGVRNLVCVGFALDVCLGTTMIDAVWRNYRVVLLRDCTYAIELPGIDEPGSWTGRWITYVECCVGFTSTSAAFLQACRDADPAVGVGAVGS